MKKIMFLVVCFLVVSSCAGRSAFPTQGDYVGGNQAAATALACHKRGSGAKNSAAYDLCVQAQKIHYQ